MLNIFSMSYLVGKKEGKSDICL